MTDKILTKNGPDFGKEMCDEVGSEKSQINKNAETDFLPILTNTDAILTQYFIIKIKYCKIGFLKSSTFLYSKVKRFLIFGHF